MIPGLQIWYGEWPSDILQVTWLLGQKVKVQKHFTRSSLHLYRVSIV